MKHRMQGLVAIAAATCVLAAPAAAGAKVYEATGKGTDDPAVSVVAKLDAKAKKGKLKKANAIDEFYARNVPFDCNVTGASGRSDYAVFPETGIKVAKNGKFSTIVEVEAGGYVIERYELAGKVKGKGKTAVVSGTFTGQKGAGGIKFGSCDTPQVAFEAKAKL